MKDQCNSKQDEPQCQEPATTRIGGVPLCKQHGDPEPNVKDGLMIDAEENDDIASAISGFTEKLKRERNNWQARAEKAEAKNADYLETLKAIADKLGIKEGEVDGKKLVSDEVRDRVDAAEKRADASQAEVRRLREAIQEHRKHFPLEISANVPWDIALWSALSPEEKGGEG